MSDARAPLEKLKRRAASISGLFAGAVLLTVTAPVWLPVVVAVDAVRVRWRFPLARLLVFAVCWCWIEIAGVLAAFWLWLTRRIDDADAHYELMGRWAGALMRALSVTIGIEPQLVGPEALEGGNAVVLARHASLADSLLSGWAIRTVAGLRPRYVLKKELLFDPCLDIVGLRIPNHFLDRQATDGDGELDSLRDLAAGIGPGVVGVIFAEGTRSNPAKRRRAIEKIAERDPDRADRMSALRHLLPPRPAGSAAMVEGASDADLVFAWHTGFDGLDSFAGMIRAAARPLPPVQFVTRRVPRAEVPVGPDFERWLDDQWLRLDAEVEASLDESD